MDNLFEQFMILFIRGHQAQCNYMVHDGWSSHHRVRMMSLNDIYSDFKKGQLRIDPLTCDEAKALHQACIEKGLYR